MRYILMDLEDPKNVRTDEDAEEQPVPTENA